MFNFDRFQAHDEFYFHPELLHHQTVNVQDALHWKKNNQNAKREIEAAHQDLLKYHLITEDQYQVIVAELAKPTSAVNGTAVLNTLVHDYRKAQVNDQSADVKAEVAKNEQTKLSASKSKSSSNVIDLSDDLPFGSEYDTKPAPKVVHRLRKVRRPQSVVKHVQQHVANVRQGGNSFNIDDFRDLLTVDPKRQQYQLSSVAKTARRLSVNVDYFQFIKAGWSVRYRNFYTDEQIRDRAVMHLVDRDVIYLLMLQDLLHEVANNGLLLEDVLHLGDALLSKPSQNRSFMASLSSQNHKWVMVQRAVFEGMREEQNKDHTLSMDEMLQKLMQQLSDVNRTLNQINVNTGISSQASLIDLLNNIGLYAPEDTRLVDQNGRLDLTRLRHLWNHDLSVQSMNAMRGQVLQNQQARQRNGYRYR